MVLPSTKDKTETSRPVINSSMTIVLPAFPNFLSSMMLLARLSFSFLQILADQNAFSKCQSVCFQYDREFGCLCQDMQALFPGSSKFSYAAVGMLYFFIRSLEKALEPSRMAAFLRGPNTRSPCLLKYIHDAANQQDHPYR